MLRTWTWGREGFYLPLENRRPYSTHPESCHAHSYTTLSSSPLVAPRCIRHFIPTYRIHYTLNRYAYIYNIFSRGRCEHPHFQSNKCMCVFFFSHCIYIEGSLWTNSSSDSNSRWSGSPRMFRLRLINLNFFVWAQRPTVSDSFFQGMFHQIWVCQCLHFTSPYESHSEQNIFKIIKSQYPSYIVN